MADDADAAGELGAWGYLGSGLVLNRDRLEYRPDRLPAARTVVVPLRSVEAVAAPLTGELVITAGGRRHRVHVGARSVALEARAAIVAALP
jgi:hypothetical protein